MRTLAQVYSDYCDEMVIDRRTQLERNCLNRRSRGSTKCGSHTAEVIEKRERVKNGSHAKARARRWQREASELPTCVLREELERRDRGRDSLLAGERTGFDPRVDPCWRKTAIASEIEPGWWLFFKDGDIAEVASVENKDEWAVVVHLVDPALPMAFRPVDQEVTRLVEQRP